MKAIFRRSMLNFFHKGGRGISVTSEQPGGKRGRGRKKKWGYGGPLLVSAASIIAHKKEEDRALSLWPKDKQFSKISNKDISPKTDLSRISEPPDRPDLPTFSMKEVSRRKSPNTGIWVTYKSGVYDISEFVEGHPGGDVILLAAGGSLEPFWALYAQHKTPDVMEILEQYRIGNLDPKEVLETRESRLSADDPFAGEPERHPALSVVSAKPFNAEVHPGLLTASFFTPNELFFVRNHLPVPHTDASTHRVAVTGCGLSRDLDLSLADLESRFKPVTVTAALQCAGNRRSGMSGVKPVKGLQWGHCAISNATWTGVRLKDVLEAAGLDVGPSSGAQHVQFEGLDRDMTGQSYGASIPIEKAIHPDTILAFRMNGKPLSRDHGHPLRLIVPGVAGARQVKWLSRIVVSSEESGSVWQQRDYRAFPPSTDMDNVDYTTAPAIQDSPVTSAITKPQDGVTLSKEEGKIEVEGYAWSGGGQGIIRVDVSGDGGRTWTTAELEQAGDQSWGRMWAWTLWKAEVPIPPSHGTPMEVVCKATNVSYNTQPESPEGIWNFRGLLNNSWHRVRVFVE